MVASMVDGPRLEALLSDIELYVSIMKEPEGINWVALRPNVTL